MEQGTVSYFVIKTLSKYRTDLSLSGPPGLGDLLRKRDQSLEGEIASLRLAAVPLSLLKHALEKVEKNTSFSEKFWSC